MSEILLPKSLPFHNCMEELISIKQQSLSISTQHANLKKMQTKNQLREILDTAKNLGSTTLYSRSIQTTSHLNLIKSKEAVRNWSCKKVSDSKYEGFEERKMHAVFKEGDCHYSSSESKKTRTSGGSFFVELNESIRKGKCRGRNKNHIKNPDTELTNKPATQEKTIPQDFPTAEQTQKTLQTFSD